MEQKGKFTFSLKSSLKNTVLIEKGGSNPVPSPMVYHGIYGDNKEHQS